MSAGTDGYHFAEELMAQGLAASVGRGGVNRLHDAANVQVFLNDWIQNGALKGAPEAFLKHLNDLQNDPDHSYSAWKS